MSEFDDLFETGGDIEDFMGAMQSRWEARQMFVDGFVHHVFPFVLNTPRLLEQGLSIAFDQPDQSADKHIWMQTGILKPFVPPVGGFDPYLVMQYAGRVASSQPWEFYFEEMSNQRPDSYALFLQAAAPSNERVWGEPAGSITPNKLATGIANGNLRFYGSEMPWLVAAGIWGTDIVNQVRVFKQEGRQWDMAWEIAVGLEQAGLGGEENVQARLQTLFAREEGGHRSYAKAVLDQHDAFTGSMFTCPAEGYVNRSFLYLSDRIGTDQFVEATTLNNNMGSLVIPSSFDF
ncbi:hypothetical protein KC909_02425 [Candidatus Dojkabacteria bacterium]|uniref:Uncharacterized protein n=1 Tax=Candidatus Dojkabacteria bacterium TaxID=2099670 RepID=A0A955L5V2_9BACT|nr:hypothetical protein [Candidatus Dojkabacteria bacterium]